MQAHQPQVSMVVADQSFFQGGHRWRRTSGGGRGCWRSSLG